MDSAYVGEAPEPLFEADIDARSASLPDLVFEALATVTERSLADLPPVSESVDLEHLESLFDGRPSGTRATFHYLDYAVVVIDGRAVKVYDSGSPTDESA